jgi:hypothetical protein
MNDICERKPEFKKHHAHRLRLLIEKLESLPRKAFDFSMWASGKLQSEPQCGTTACAGGWATTIPVFRRAGLFLVNTSPHSDIQYANYDVLYSPEGKPDRERPFMYHEGHEAMAEVLGLTEDEACVFIPHGWDYGHVTRSSIVRRLKRLLRDKIHEAERLRGRKLNW